MKKLLLLLLLFPLFFQCNSTKKSSTDNSKAAVYSFDPETSILVRRDKNTGEFSFAVPEEILIRSLKVADLEIDTVHKVFIQASGEQHAYLIFHAQDTAGNSVKKAVYMRQLTQGIFKAEDADHTREPISHTCGGACCVNCEFILKEEKLNGCQCIEQCAKALPDAAGYCNHVINKKVNSILGVL